jgi:hypothetical protein
MTDDAWLETVRLARDFGPVSSLFPPGFDDLRDLPHALFHAIRLAGTFLTFEDLEERDRPPKRIWLDGERLRDWFDEVRRRRTAEARGESREIEDPVQNQAALDLIAR